MICYSHPNKKLKDHLENVKDIGMYALSEKILSIPKELKNTLEIILSYHDFAKSTLFFQDYLNSSINNEICKHSSKLTSHSLLSACLSAYKIYNSLQENNWSILGFLAVKKHHGDLENLDKMIVVNKNDWRNLTIQWQNIECEFKEEAKNINFDKIKEIVDDFLWEKDELIGSIDTFLILNFIFSILIYSDKTEVVLGKPTFIKLPNNIENFITNYKSKTFSNKITNNLNKIREKAYQVAYENLQKIGAKPILSLNLPTGIGKTLNVLNIASNIYKHHKEIKRIIYALPFTSIIDQTEKIVKNIFEKNNENPDDFLIVHHHLAEAKIKNDENYIEGDKAEFLIENWDKPFILTTFWQLFNSIITNKNSQLRKFHNISNSVIILDEVQSIPYKYWQLIEIVLKKLTELFNCKVILMTATMPLIFDENELFPLIPPELRDEFFTKFSRYKISILNSLKDLTLEELIEIAINDIRQNRDKSFLFVFNTIKTSIKFYELLKENLPEKEFIYLSSNILPIERKKRIEKIVNNPQGKIIISTQVVEAGVDIDMDIVYRDFAPLDSIIQTAGRANRNNKKDISTVNIFKLKNENGKYDYSYIYKGLPLNATNEIFQNVKVIEEKDILKLIKQYFQIIKENKSNNESAFIINAMEKLKFTDVSEKFKLIDEIPSFSMFIEINEEAGKLLNRFCEIMQIQDIFERKKEFLKIKSNFYQYVLSVKLSDSTKSYFQDLEEIGGIKIVRADLVKSIYDEYTGLIKEVSMFI